MRENERKGKEEGKKQSEEEGKTKITTSIRKSY